ncbi:MAG TPA: phasin family protein [Accumulibacter sp.]|jgi:phasin family protein|nr:phasin family protein [Accumulibacter sp.]
MRNVTEKFAGARELGLETFTTMMNASLDGISQLAALNLQTARAFVKSGAENIKALSAVRDVHDLTALQQPAMALAVENSLVYSRRAYEICSESSNALVRVFEGQVSEIGGGVASLFEQSRQNTPPLFAPVFDIVADVAKSALAAVQAGPRLV